MTTAARTESKQFQPAEGTLAALILQTLEEKQVGSAQELATELRKDVATIETECERMVRRHELDVLRTDDLEIIRTLGAEENGDAPVATADLNRALGDDGRRAYGRCKRMEERIGLLRSHARPGDALRCFFPVTGDILTQTTVPQIQGVIEDLKQIALGSGLGTGRQIPEPLKRTLTAKYRGYFARLREGKSDRVQAQIGSFEGELMRVFQGTTLSDVIGLLGVRSFHPRIREWQLDYGANPTGPLIDAIIDWILDNSDAHGHLPGSVYLVRHRPPQP